LIIGKDQQVQPSQAPQEATPNLPTVLLAQRVLREATSQGDPVLPTADKGQLVLPTADKGQLVPPTADKGQLVPPTVTEVGLAVPRDHVKGLPALGEATGVGQKAQLDPEKALRVLPGAGLSHQLAVALEVQQVRLIMKGLQCYWSSIIVFESCQRGFTPIK